MRSSKSRSRSKTNRPRPMGNVVNRVFDSSGPEGKVRGTPQQIIDKYMILARDAQLSNDRVAAENFLQHAEHYTRMLGEAQRELQREAESRRDYQDNNQNGQQRDNRDRPRREAEEAEVPPAFYTPEPQRQAPSATDVIDFNGDDESETSVLVDTPESRPEPQEPPAPVTAPVTAQAAEPEAPAEAAPARREPNRRSASERRPAAPAAEAESEDAAPVDAGDGTAAADGAAMGEKRPRNTRRRTAPRKPKSSDAEVAPKEASVGE